MIVDLAQILLTFALVAVTAIYAYSTQRISSATRRQAEASLKMAEETKKQADASLRMAEETKRQAEASMKMAKAMMKPVLIPYFELSSDFDSSRNVYFEAGVHNDGNGPAYDLEFDLRENASRRPLGQRVAAVRAHSSAPCRSPDSSLYFPKSERVDRRFFVVKYRDVDGQYELIQPFVLTTADKNKPIAMLEGISTTPLSTRSTSHHDS